MAGHPALATAVDMTRSPGNGWDTDDWRYAPYNDTRTSGRNPAVWVLGGIVVVLLLVLASGGRLPGRVAGRSAHRCARGDPHRRSRGDGEPGRAVNGGTELPVRTDAPGGAGGTGSIGRAGTRRYRR